MPPLLDLHCQILHEKREEGMEKALGGGRGEGVLMNEREPRITREKRTETIKKRPSNLDKYWMKNSPRTVVTIISIDGMPQALPINSKEPVSFQMEKKKESKR